MAKKNYIKGGDRILDRRDYSKWFFGLSVILALSYGWAVYDEFFTRRSYVAFEEEFQDWELSLAQAEYSEAMDKFEGSDKADKVKNLRAELAKAKENAGGKEAAELEEQLYSLDSEYDHWDRSFKDVKSVQDAIFYKWKHAVHKGHETESETTSQKLEKEAEKWEKEYDDLQAQLDEIAGKRAEVDKQRKAVQSDLDDLSKVDELQAELDELLATQVAFEDRIDEIKSRDTREIRQYVNDRLGVGEEYTFGMVDRCHTCHMNIDRPGFERPEEQPDADLAKKFASLRPVYQTHPRRKDVFGPHPVKEHGCTVCHQGDGRATRFMPDKILGIPVGAGAEKGFVEPDDKPHGLDHYWDLELLTSAPTPYFESVEAKNEFYEKVGEDASPAEMKKLAEAAEEENMGNEALPAGWFGSVEASCHKCHREQRWIHYGFKIDEETGREVADKAAPLYEKGKDLFISKGCQGCHLVKGFGGLPKIGPDLSHISNKVRPEWLVDWIYDPKAFRPDTRMPQFIFPPAEGHPEPKAYYPEDLTDAQKERQREVATTLAAYLWQQSRDAQPMPFGRYPGGGNAARGYELVKTVGCLACHTVDDGKGNRIGELDANRLDNVGAKVQSPDWIYNWIQEPKWHSPGTRMPDLRLTRSEARDVTAWLWQNSASDGPARNDALREKLNDPKLKEEGELLMAKVGCPACHLIPDQEHASRIGPELTKFAEKATYELAFGDADIEQTWEAWARNKLRNPRLYIDERSSSRMPNLHLKDDEIEALMVWLEAMRRPLVPDDMKKQFLGRNAAIERGRQLVNYYNCIGCHQIEGRGGNILYNYVDGLPEQEQAALSPPNLKGEGLKIQASFLNSFFRSPREIRPWLNIRMPSFNLSDAQWSDIISYFRALQKVESPYDEIDLVGATPESIARGSQLFRKYQCTNCHLFQGKRPGGELGPRNGPDLANVPIRMRPDGVKAWLQNPTSMMPGTAMPGFFFYEGDNGELVPMRETSAQEVNDIVNFLFVGPHTGRSTAMR